MNEIDALMRTMLAERAHDVPEAPGLLDGVHRTVRRHRTRRRAVASLAVALVMLIAASVAWSVERDDDRLVPTERPSASPSATASPSPKGLTAPASPVSLGRLPDGFSSRPTVTLDSVRSWTLTTTRVSPPATVEVQVSTVELTERTNQGSWRQYATTRTIDLAGTPATLSVVPHRPDWPDAEHQSYWGAYSELTFARRPGQWVRIEAYRGDDSSADPAVTEADLRTIAGGLVDRPTPVEDLLRFPALPAGLTFGSLEHSSDAAGVQLVDPASPAASTNRPYGGMQWDLPRAPIVVVAGGGDTAAQSVGANTDIHTALTVDGRTVQSYRSGYPKRQVLSVSLGEGRSIAVSAADSLGLSTEELARFLFGITPGPDLPN
ncbi:hypothetical protein [Cryptosporangium aurantiacum]|uniref:Uncharacterized protein n=1 Tax=Cryptosporangium aurantiacum TaxID=134849 RepID=A0A1M7RKX5_9ACTN|nr:hypothetical protein [Cryptosporangium aurantiacum]SHN46995.1 hypothetical protein SAMN05443668_11991 [Cryptosporangium aurantiacum]